MIKKYRAQASIPDLTVPVTDLTALVGADFISITEELHQHGISTVALNLKDAISGANLDKVNLYMSDQDCGQDLFGRYYNYAENDALQEITSTSFVVMLSLVTRTLPIGDYFASWFATISGDTLSNPTVKVEIDNDAGSFILHGRVRYNSVNDVSDRYCMSGFKQLTVGTKRAVNLKISMKSGTGSTVRIRDARLTLWRIA